MGRGFGSPGRYIQIAGCIDTLATHLATLGRRVLCLVDGALHETHARRLGDDGRAAGLAMTVTKFGGECCTRAIDALVAAGERDGCDVVVGFGGGKTIDTAKLAAERLSARCVIMPSIASTDAPCSAIAVRYTDDGVYVESKRLRRNPDLVLVDPDIIVRAPVRFLVAGIGDAYSTWFEARSNLESRSPNYVGTGHAPTAAGIAIARACHDVLTRDARLAASAASRGLRTASVDNIIEANILLSGLGFENCGCSAAHGIHNGLTALSATHRLLHGEKVAFGTLSLLTLEHRDAAEIADAIGFCRDLGLPTTLSDLGLKDATRDDIERVAAASLLPGECTHATPVTLSVQSVTDAILATDAHASSDRARPRR